MSEILLYYRRPDPTTWVYLSSFLTIGLFFVFHRFWSIRNVDILLLILLAPGLLMVHEGYRRQLIESETLARQKGQRSEDDRPQGQGREALLRTRNCRMLSRFAREPKRWHRWWRPSPSLRSHRSML